MMKTQYLGIVVTVRSANGAAGKDGTLLRLCQCHMWQQLSLARPACLQPSGAMRAATVYCLA